MSDSDIVQGLARIETQTKQVEERISEIRKSLYGDDGAGGMVQRIMGIEGAIVGVRKQVEELNDAITSFKRAGLKALVLVVGSSMASGGAVAKVLMAFSP